MKRFLLYVLGAFLLEVLLLSVLQDQPALHALMPKQDRALTFSFWLAWPLGLIGFLFINRKRGTSKNNARSLSTKSKSGSFGAKNAKSKRQSGGSTAKRSARNA